MKQERCESCNRQVANHDIVRYGSQSEGYRKLCTCCFNAQVADAGGTKSFHNAQFAPITLVDGAGFSHTFHFQYRHVPTGVSLEAFQLGDEGPRGYRYGVIGTPADDPFKLLAELVAKMRRGLANQHLVDSPYGPQIADHGTVRGHIECALDSPDQRPLLVIDGQEITWDDFGRMLMTYEGSAFKLIIRGMDEDSG